MPASKRAAVETLWRLDAAFGAVLATGTEPMISRIRLAWWREALEKLDMAPPPAEPLLRALAEHVLPCGVAGAELAAMEEGWAAIAPGERLTPDNLARHGAARGARLFELSARLLGDESHPVAQAGRHWALVDLARHSAAQDERGAAFLAAGAVETRGRWPARLRPLGMISALARRDRSRGPERAERPGSPGRMLRMMRHRLTGY